MLDSVAEFFGLGIAAETETPTVNLEAPDTEATSTAQSIVNAVELPSVTIYIPECNGARTADTDTAFMLQAETRIKEKDIMVL